MNKVYLAVDKDGTEWISQGELAHNDRIWFPKYMDDAIFQLPSGTIRRLIGRDLTWEDEPVELTSEMLKFE